MTSRSGRRSGPCAIRRRKRQADVAGAAGISHVHRVPDRAGPPRRGRGRYAPSRLCRTRVARRDPRPFARRRSRSDGQRAPRSARRVDHLAARVDDFPDGSCFPRCRSRSGASEASSILRLAPRSPRPAGDRGEDRDRRCRRDARHARSQASAGSRDRQGARLGSADHVRLARRRGEPDEHAPDRRARRDACAPPTPRTADGCAAGWGVRRTSARSCGALECGGEPASRRARPPTAVPWAACEGRRRRASLPWPDAESRVRVTAASGHQARPARARNSLSGVWTKWRRAR